MRTRPRIGVTATQAGTTPEQRAAVTARLLDLQPCEVHHGDCVGGDTDLHHIVRQHLPSTRIVVHPPDNPAKRAFVQGDEIWRPAPYLVRDQEIVATTDRLVALPGGPERARSGTWYTVRFADAQGRAITIVWPDGSIEERPAGTPPAPTYEVRRCWQHDDVEVQHHFDPARPRFEVWQAGTRRATIHATRAWKTERRQAIAAAESLAGRTPA